MPSDEQIIWAVKYFPDLLIVTSSLLYIIPYFS